MQKKRTKIKRSTKPHKFWELMSKELLSSFCETFKKDIEKWAVIKWITNGGQSPNNRKIEPDIRQIKIKPAYTCTAS